MSYTSNNSLSEGSVMFVSGQGKWSTLEHVLAVGINDQTLSEVAGVK